MSYGLIATLIVLVIVVGAIVTKKCEAFLIAGSMVGALVLWKGAFLTQWVATLEEVMADEAYVILLCGLFGSLVALLTASKGSFGFTKIVTRICNSERKTLLTTFALGIIIFVDDYLNVLSNSGYTVMFSVKDDGKEIDNIAGELNKLGIHSDILGAPEAFRNGYIAVVKTRVLHRNQFIALAQILHWAGQAVNKQIAFALGENVVANPCAAGALPIDELVGVVHLLYAIVQRLF